MPKRVYRKTPYPGKIKLRKVNHRKYEAQGSIRPMMTHLRKNHHGAYRVKSRLPTNPQIQYRPPMVPTRSPLPAGKSSGRTRDPTNPLSYLTMPLPGRSQFIRNAAYPIEITRNLPAAVPDYTAADPGVPYYNPTTTSNRLSNGPTPAGIPIPEHPGEDLIIPLDLPIIERFRGFEESQVPNTQDYLGWMAVLLKYYVAYLDVINQRLQQLRTTTDPVQKEKLSRDIENFQRFEYEIRNRIFRQGYRQKLINIFREFDPNILIKFSNESPESFFSILLKALQRRSQDPTTIRNELYPLAIVILRRIGLTEAQYNGLTQVEKTNLETRYPIITRFVLNPVFGAF